MKSLWLSLSCVVLAFALAACGDNDDMGSGGTGGTGSGSGGMSGTGGSPDGSGGGDNVDITFFVSSQTSMTGDLGGLAGADEICHELAGHVGAASHTFKAYLSADADPANDDMPVDARDRIGTGPWYNAKGVLLAEDLDALHARIGDADVFLDEYGEKIPGQWQGSTTPIEHDILTGSNADGTLAEGKTCASWTSSDASDVAVVGHSDGLGPGMATTGTYTSWNSAHDNMDCSDTAPKGGAGRIYCFAAE